jgi:hypothetical protein
VNQKTQPCTIDGCVKLIKGRGWCSKHYDRWRKHGDPLAFIGSLPGSDSPKWQGDDIGYEAAHVRVRTARGSASGYVCEDCGGSARHWAYDHADPEEKQSEAGAYSPRPEHYRSLCGPCHRVFDLRPPVEV